MLEHLAEIFSGGIETLVVQHFGEGHVDIEVVLLDGIRDAVRRPSRQSALVNLAQRAKFGGRAETHADHLSGPAAGDLVVQVGKRDLAISGMRRGRKGHSAGERGKTKNRRRHDPILPDAARKDAAENDAAGNRLAFLPAQCQERARLTAGPGAGRMIRPGTRSVVIPLLLLRGPTPAVLLPLHLSREFLR